MTRAHAPRQATAITLWRVPPDKTLLAAQAAAAAEKVEAIQRGKLAWWKLASDKAAAAVDVEEKAEEVAAQEQADRW